VVVAVLQPIGAGHKWAVKLSSADQDIISLCVYYDLYEGTSLLHQLPPNLFARKNILKTTANKRAWISSACWSV